MIHVLAEASVGCDDYFREGILDCTNSFLRNAIFGKGLAGFIVLVLWDAEQDNSLYAKVVGLLNFCEHGVDALLVNTRHGGNRFLDIGAGNNKERIDKLFH